MKPEREDYLNKVTIGKPQEVNGKVVLAKYDKNWATIFENEKKTISALLPDAIIEHVGSTAVANLCAKPIIDILLLVDDSSDEKSYLPKLKQADYYLRIREADWFEHRLFKKNGLQINLHVFSKDCLEAKRMIAFRDILRNNQEAFTLYANKKRELANRNWKYLQEYADAKSEVVKTILENYK